MNYILALDAGTTSNRCIVYDEYGNSKAIAQKEFTQYYPSAGFVEQDGNEIFSSMLGVIVEAMASCNISSTDIISIGIANQRETTLIWDRKNGEPLYNAIVWQCRRTSDLAYEIKEKYSDLIYAKTGLVPDAYFSATKIKWLFDNIKGLKEKAQANEICFGTIDTWLMYKLSRGKIFATDYSNAGRTMLFNIHELVWDRELLDLFDIPFNILPEVKESASLFGYTDQFYFPNPIKICGVAGDQQAALIGQRCFSKGEAKNTYGTGGFLLMNTGCDIAYSRQGLLSTIAYSINGKVSYALEGSVFVAGDAIKWLRDELKFIETAKDSEYMALKVNDCNGCYVVPAFTGLGAPYWNQYAKGMIIGLNRNTNKYHIIRATLESIAYEIKDVFDAMNKDVNCPVTLLRVDGGASANNLLLQMQADLLNINIERPYEIESTAKGAFYLAALGSGLYTLEEILNLQEKYTTFKPAISEKERNEKWSGWQKAIKALEIWSHDE